jgi:putative phosphoribosyl transferase
MPFQLSPRPEVLFRDRASAGVQLTDAIRQVAQPEDSFVVYALPRGGLPVAAPVAGALHCPLDIVVAKKVTRPNHPELALGAVTAEGHLLVPRDQVTPEDIQQAEAKAQVQQAQFAHHTKADPKGAIALLIDDGIATGMTIAVLSLCENASRKKFGFVFRLLLKMY